ncbi:MAG: fumarylacetoacetate hydrolase family protein, partial [Casimicrobiaceae bacterium]
MKLATLGNGTRDGKLVVVSRDLARCVAVPEIARTLQGAIDAWSAAAPSLAAIAVELDARRMPGAVLFDPAAAMAPLPRAYQWADGSAYVNHVELVRKARGAALPREFWTDPLMYQGASDHMLGAREDIVLADEGWGIDFEAEVAVITDDVPMGTQAADAEDHIRLLLLVNDVSLRNLIPGELAKGFGFFQSKPASAFSPVAVTLDELGSAWRHGKVHL